jgi:hypothetical protein
MVVGGLFVLPTVLQTEPQPQRADAVQAEGAGGGAGGGKGRSSHAASYRQTAAQTRQPFYGGVRDAPLSALETLSSLRARGASAPQRASLELENPQVESFSTASADLSSLAPLAIPDGQILPIGAVGGVAPPVTTNPGNPITPPIIIPPVVTPPVVTPPIVTPPVVTPPITGPTTPPVITPPDDPPVTPPVVIPPDPPPADPGFPSGPIGGGPGGPGRPGPIPEPATWIQLILGAAMVGAVLRRRSAQPLTALRARSSALAVASRLGWAFGMRFQASSAATL